MLVSSVLILAIGFGRTDALFDPADISFSFDIWPSKESSDDTTTTTGLTEKQTSSSQGPNFSNGEDNRRPLKASIPAGIVNEYYRIRDISTECQIMFRRDLTLNSDYVRCYNVLYVSHAFDRAPERSANHFGAFDIDVIENIQAREHLIDEVEFDESGYYYFNEQDIEKISIQCDAVFPVYDWEYWWCFTTLYYSYEIEKSNTVEKMKAVEARRDQWLHDHYPLDVGFPFDEWDSYYYGAYEYDDDSLFDRDTSCSSLGCNTGIIEPSLSNGNNAPKDLLPPPIPQDEIGLLQYLAEVLSEIVELLFIQAAAKPRPGPEDIDHRSIPIISTVTPILAPIHVAAATGAIYPAPVPITIKEKMFLRGAGAEDKF